MKQIPQNYGLSLLKSMGFTPQRGIGLTNRNTNQESHAVEFRNNRLGLGATISGMKINEKFLIKPGKQVIVLQGIHKGLKGLVIEQLKKGVFSVKIHSQAILSFNKEQLILKQLAQKNNSKERSRSRQKQKQVYLVNNVQKQKQYLLSQGMIVRIINKQSKYYMLKGIIIQMLEQNKYRILFQQGKRRVFQQNHLQNVVPKVGQQGIIISGIIKGKKITVTQRNLKQGWVIAQDQDRQIYQLQLQQICLYKQF